MITVFELRKIVNNKSSDKAKFYAGSCSLRKKTYEWIWGNTTPIKTYCDKK